MARIFNILSFLITLQFYLCATPINFSLNSELPGPVSHDLWDRLLKKHVGQDGFVDYQGMVRDSAALNDYLDLLASSHPDKSWSKAQVMAYWINAYNAYTVKLIVDHYPLSSIKDIKKGIPFVNTVWDIKFIYIQGKTYDLNNIEHGILRKDYNDARIHAAVNCASFSCPKLRPEAFVADKLDEQLDDSMKSFVNDQLRNQISAEKAQLSSIFNWFKGDFKSHAGSLEAFINKYSKQKISGKTVITFLDYDWSINDVNQKI